MDINGLNKVDQDRIREIGFSKWLMELEAPKPKPVPTAPPTPVPSVTSVTPVPTTPNVVPAGAINVQYNSLKNNPRDTVGERQIIEFQRIGMANNNIVTYQQAEQIYPTPGDPVQWMRWAGAEVITERLHSRYRIIKYVNI